MTWSQIVSQMLSLTCVNLGDQTPGASKIVGAGVNGTLEGASIREPYSDVGHTWALEEYLRRNVV